jgi:hypothetical protein
MEAAIELVFEIFGKRAFLRFDGERDRYMPRFNIAVFDLMTWYFSDGKVRAAAAGRPVEIADAFEQLCKADTEFSQYLTSTTKSPEAVLGRLDRWGTGLGSVLDLPLSASNFVEPFLPIAARSRR